MTALDSFIASVSFIFQRKKPQDQDVLSDWAVEAKHGIRNVERTWTGRCKTHLEVLGHCQESKN